MDQDRLPGPSSDKRLQNIQIPTDMYTNLSNINMANTPPTLPLLNEENVPPMKRSLKKLKINPVTQPPHHSLEFNAHLNSHHYAFSGDAHSDHLMSNLHEEGILHKMHRPSGDSGIPPNHGQLSSNPFQTGSIHTVGGSGGLRSGGLIGGPGGPRGTGGESGYPHHQQFGVGPISSHREFSPHHGIVSRSSAYHQPSHCHVLTPPISSASSGSPPAQYSHQDSASPHQNRSFDSPSQHPSPVSISSNASSSTYYRSTSSHIHHGEVVSDSRNSNHSNDLTSHAAYTQSSHPRVLPVSHPHSSSAQITSEEITSSSPMPLPSILMQGVHSPQQQQQQMSSLPLPAQPSPQQPHQQHPSPSPPPLLPPPLPQQQQQQQQQPRPPYHSPHSSFSHPLPLNSRRRSSSSLNSFEPTSSPPQPRQSLASDLPIYRHHPYPYPNFHPPSHPHPFSHSYSQQGHPSHPSHPAHQSHPSHPVHPVHSIHSVHPTPGSHNLAASHNAYPISQLQPTFPQQLPPVDPQSQGLPPPPRTPIPPIPPFGNTSTPSYSSPHVFPPQPPSSVLHSHGSTNPNYRHLYSSSGPHSVPPYQNHPDHYPPPPPLPPHPDSHPHPHHASVSNVYGKRRFSDIVDSSNSFSSSNLHGGRHPLSRVSKPSPGYYENANQYGPLPSSQSPSSFPPQPSSLPSISSQSPNHPFTASIVKGYDENRSSIPMKSELNSDSTLTNPLITSSSRPDSRSLSNLSLNNNPHDDPNTVLNTSSNNNPFSPPHKPVSTTSPTTTGTSSSPIIPSTTAVVLHSSSM